MSLFFSSRLLDTAEASVFFSQAKPNRTNSNEYIWTNRKGKRALLKPFLAQPKPNQPNPDPNKHPKSRFWGFRATTRATKFNKPNTGGGNGGQYVSFIFCFEEPESRE